MINFCKVILLAGQAEGGDVSKEHDETFNDGHFLAYDVFRNGLFANRRSQ
jgi:hypothetical protein